MQTAVGLHGVVFAVIGNSARVTFSVGSYEATVTFPLDEITKLDGPPTAASPQVADLDRQIADVESMMFTKFCLTQS